MSTMPSQGVPHTYAYPHPYPHVHVQNDEGLLPYMCVLHMSLWVCLYVDVHTHTYTIVCIYVCM